MQPLRSTGRERVPFTDLGRTREAVLAGALASGSSVGSYQWVKIIKLTALCIVYLALLDIFEIHQINLKFSFSLISQERFRVGAFAGGSAAELPSLEEELAQVFKVKFDLFDLLRSWRRFFFKSSWIFLLPEFN